MNDFKCGFCGRKAVVDDQMIDIALEHPRNILCDECYLPIKPGDKIYTLPPVQGTIIRDED